MLLLKSVLFSPLFVNSLVLNDHTIVWASPCIELKLASVGQLITANIMFRFYYVVILQYDNAWWEKSLWNLKGKFYITKT